MIKRVRQWLVWVFEGGPAVAGEDWAEYPFSALRALLNPGVCGGPSA